jgi:DNA-binding NtrC family response regulator
MARILLVDDEASVLQTLNMLLKSDGHEVIAHADAESALASLKEDETFDLLATDIRMSPMDGISLIEVSRELRPEMPIVVISAYCSQKTIDETMSLGCKAYVKKPFKIQEVLEAIRGALPSA